MVEDVPLLGYEMIADDTAVGDERTHTDGVHEREGVFFVDRLRHMFLAVAAREETTEQAERQTK